MQFLTLALTTLVSLASAAPTPVSNDPTPVLAKRFVEETPWHLANVRAFTANPGPSGVSSFSFHFCDTNTGIELETECSRYLPPGSGRSPIDPDNYYPCNNNTVGFKYTGDALYIQRSYHDLSVGQPPYDVVTAFGNSNVTFEVSSDEAGTTATAEAVEVPITSLIAK